MVVWNPEAVDTDWVFGYGSLIWNPEFEFERSELARLHGYHRAYCLHSQAYRGTKADPGALLGLDRGGSCVGVAFKLARPTRAVSMQRLYAREVPNTEVRVYLPTLLQARLGTGETVRILAFVADRASPLYQRMADCEVLARLARCHGSRGSNREYALNTWRSLEARGVHDETVAKYGRQLLDLEQAATEPVGRGETPRGVATPA